MTIVRDLLSVVHNPFSAVLAVCLATGWRASAAQELLSPVRAAGQTVTPVFEGWYRNPDGTYSISFGYFNRNASEVLDVPIGPDNNIAPGDPNQGQPTHFRPRRHWGVFAVTVPADFGDRKVVWTLRVRGETYAIAGSLKAQWEIDAIRGEAGSGNTPPVLKFDAGGPEGRGPRGIQGATHRATVGQPLALKVWASDDGTAWRNIGSEGRAGVPVSLTWFKHQGLGEVVFSDASPRTDANGLATTTATFREPGEYVLRVRANDASGVTDAGHAQCCWTNGFVKVTVSR
jgi:hypothetical protein